MRAFLAVLLVWTLTAVAPAQARPVQGYGSATVPLCNNVSVNVGEKTPLNMGTAFLRNMGIAALTSAPIASWRTSGVVAHGGGAPSDLGGLLASNTATATARSPKPTLGSISSLTVTTLAAVSYDTTVVAVTAAGAEATCTLTYVTVPSAFNLGDNNANFGDPDNMVNDTVSIRYGTKTGGLTMLLSTGARFTSVPVLYFHSFAPTSGRTTVQYADPARPSRVPSLHLTDISNFDITGLGIGGGYAVHKIWLDGTTTGSTVKNSYPLGATILDVSIGNHNAGNVNFIYLQGVAGNTVDNNWLQWGGRGIVLSSGTNGNTVSNNTIRYVYGDLNAIGKSTNDIVTGNLMLATMRDTDTSGSPDHVDNAQWDTGFAGTTNTLTGLLYAGNIMAQADGTAGSSGFQGGVNTYVNPIWKNNISLFRASTAANLSLWQGGTIQDSTWLLVGSGLIGMEALNANDNIYNGQVGFHDDVGGSGNALTRVFVTYAATMSGAWTVTNSPNHTFSLPNNTQFTYDGVNFNHQPVMNGDTYATTGVFKYANTLERLNNLTATNTAGADYPHMTPAQIKALFLDVLTPATGGSLDLGGANCNTIGAVCRDGTLKP